MGRVAGGLPVRIPHHLFYYLSTKIMSVGEDSPNLQSVDRIDSGILSFI